MADLTKIVDDLSKLTVLEAAELSKLTGLAVKTIYNQRGRCKDRGALAPILTKLGGRVGCWRADYDVFVASQRRLVSPTP